MLVLSVYDEVGGRSFDKICAPKDIYDTVLELIKSYKQNKTSEVIRRIGLLVNYSHGKC